MISAYTIRFLLSEISKYSHRSFFFQLAAINVCIFYIWFFLRRIQYVAWRASENGQGITFSLSQTTTSQNTRKVNKVFFIHRKYQNEENRWEDNPSFQGMLSEQSCKLVRALQLLSHNITRGGTRQQNLWELEGTHLDQYVRTVSHPWTGSYFEHQNVQIHIRKVTTAIPTTYHNLESSHHTVLQRQNRRAMGESLSNQRTTRFLVLWENTTTRSAYRDRCRSRKAV
jgi:hypothetical protein